MLSISIGFVPLKPAEFVILRIRQMTDRAQATTQWLEGRRRGCLTLEPEAVPPGGIHKIGSVLTQIKATRQSGVHKKTRGPLKSKGTRNSG